MHNERRKKKVCFVSYLFSISSPKEVRDRMIKPILRTTVPCDNIC